jgi:hypothetical protein
VCAARDAVVLVVASALARFRARASLGFSDCLVLEIARKPASVRIEGPDRAGLERPLRYCARPAFALERLEHVADERLIYRLPKPQPDGRTELAAHTPGTDRLAGRAHPAPDRWSRHRSPSNTRH